MELALPYTNLLRTFVVPREILKGDKNIRLNSYGPWTMDNTTVLPPYSHYTSTFVHRRDIVIAGKKCDEGALNAKPDLPSGRQSIKAAPLDCFGHASLATTNVRQSPCNKRMERRSVYEKKDQLIHTLQKVFFALLCFAFVTKASAYSVTSVSVGAQSGSLTYGTAGSVTYTITLGMTGTAGGTTDLSLNWTPPTGVTSSFSPSNPITLTGNGQTITLTVNTTAATLASPYSFTVTSSDGSVTSGNVSFLVNKRPLSIKASDQSKFYGQTKVFTGTSLVATGLVNSDDVTSVTLTSTGAVNTADAGAYPIVVTPGSENGTGLGNYIISYVDGTLTVDPAPLTITGDNVSKIYGTVLTGGAGFMAFSSSGLKNGETIGSVTIAYGSGAAANAPTGIYASSVTPSLATGGTFNPANYDITYVGGQITVTSNTTTIAVVSDLNPSCTGSEVKLTAIITATQTDATGTVRFLDGGVQVGSATVISNQASLLISSLAVGNRTITAEYDGDGNYDASTSPAITQIVRANPTTAAAGPDQTGTTTCGLTSITLAANPPTVGTGAWSMATGTGGSFGNASSPTSTFTGISGNSYTLRWTISNGPCIASTSDMLVTFNSLPSVNHQPTDDQALCANSPTTAIIFSGTTGASYTWTNDQPSIGLAATGAGNIASFTASNSGNANVTATIAVTPHANGCDGTAKNFIITVKPRPVVTADVVSQTICSGSNIAQVKLTSNVAGSNTFSWTRDNVAGLTGGGGLAGFNGSGSGTVLNINGSFTSTLAAQGTMTLHATATSGGCTGATTDFSVKVNPVATVDPIADKTYCRSATAIGPINFSSSLASTFNWSNSNTGIGLGSGQTGVTSTPSFTPPNITAPVSGVITVTPVYVNGSSCPGTSSTFNITINPKPVFTGNLSPAAICSGTPFNYTPATSATGVTISYVWDRPAATGISNPAVNNATGNVVNDTLYNTTASAATAQYQYRVVAENNGVSCTSNRADVNLLVNPSASVVLSPSGDQNICSGNNITPVTFSNGGSRVILGTTLDWKRSNNTIGGTIPLNTYQTTNPISGTLSVSDNALHTATFTVRSKTTAGCYDSTQFKVNVYPSIAGNTILASQVSQVAFCSLTEKLTIATPPPTGGNGSYTYQWQVSNDNVTFTNIPGPVGTASTLVAYDIATFSDYYFRRVVTSISGPGGCSNTSPAYHITPGTGDASSVVGACTGGSGMDIWVIASYVGATYRLQKYNTSTTNWDYVGSAGTLTGDGDSVNFEGITAQGTYRIEASTSGSCKQIVNGTVVIDANTLPVAGSIITSATTPICAGSTANLSATYTSAPAGSNPGYLWYTIASGGTALNPTTPSLEGAPYTVTPPVPISNPDTVVTYYAKAVYTATGCKSSLRAPVTVRVNKIPASTIADSFGVCSGSPVGLSFTNNYGAGVSYEWKALADNPNVTGESLSPVTNGTLNNTLATTANTTQTVQYSVIPKVTATGCTGIADTFKVTVDPRPVVTDRTLIACSGTRFTISPTNGSGNTIPVSPVTQYTWGVPTGSGFTPVAGGTGPNFTDSLVNGSTAPLTAVYTVTPSGGACIATPFTVTVTLNPAPSIADQTVTTCNGIFTLPPFTSSNLVPSNTTYSWSAPTGANISGMASGTDQVNITGNLTNTSSPVVPVTATYTVTPKAPAAVGGCSGKPFTILATINPTPAATMSANITVVCQGGTSPVITFTGSGGTAPYTFTYTIDGGSPITTAPGNNINVPVSTTNAGTFTYALTGVSDNLGASCIVPQTGNEVITVNPLAVIPAQNTRACSGSLFSVSPTNNPSPLTVVPAGTTYSWAVPALPAGVTGASPGIDQPSFSQTLINNSGTLKNITYTVTPKSGTCPGASFQVTVVLDPAVAANTAIWTGLSNSNWCDPFNWACGIVPDASKDAIIPSGTTNQPSISGSCNAFVKDLDLQGSATLNLDAGRGLDIYGDFISPSTPGRYTLNGTVTFAGYNQNVPGFTYSGLSVKGGGTKTLSGDAVVNGNLTLINGIISSSVTNTLTIGTTANVSAGSNISYIVGPLTRLTNSTNTYIFPVGGNGRIRNAYVIPETNAPSSYTVFYHPSAPIISSITDPTLTGILMTEHWDILRNSGTADAVVGMDYVNPNSLAAEASTGDWSSSVNPCAFCNVAVVGGDGAYKWNFPGLGPGFGATEATYWQSNNTVYSRRLLNNFGQFTFGYAYAVILPVQLITFTGSLQGNNGLLEWKYADAREVASTELQHSTDGRHFDKLATVGTTSANAYHYMHANLKGGSHFYRLLIRDNSGKVTFSNIVLLTVGNDITVIKGVRPTMARSETFIDIHSAKAQSVRVIVLDISGRTVSDIRGNMVAGENSMRINTQLLSQGLYMLHVSTEDSIKATLRFVKE